MKHLILLFFAAMIVSCEKKGPKFKVGDCLTSFIKKESWEEPMPIYKILEVGIRKYRYVWYSKDLDVFVESTLLFETLEAREELIDCPAKLKEIK